MPTHIREFKPSHNADILNAIRNNASSMYQSRVPNATKASFKDAIQAMWDYRPARNEFLDALVNQIGMIIARDNSWNNELAKFKTGMLEYGDTIEEYIVGYAEGRTYEHDRDYLEKVLFGQEIPEVQAVYHKINREQFYKVTIKQFALKRALQNPNGLSDFVVRLMASATNADNYDEYLLTTGLIKTVHDTAGMFKINVPDVGAQGSDGNDARYTLRRMREAARNLAVPSRHYNAARMPVHASPEDLELIITPEAEAAIDVEGLAAAFNIDKADFAARKTVIPREYWGDGMQHAQAMITTRDFFLIADSLYETASQQNAAGMYENHFLHHHSVISSSPFAPVLLFTTEPGDVIDLNRTPVVGVNDLTVHDRAGDEVDEVERGELYMVKGSAITDPEGGVNDAVILELDGAQSARTRLYQTGHLTVALDEAAEELTVRATSEDDSDFNKTLTIPVTGEYVTYNNPGLGLDGDGLPEVTPTEPTEADGTVTIPSVTGVQYSVDGSPVTNGSTHEVGDGITVTAAARTGYVLADGVTTEWEFPA